jgi:hypothetical protein
MRELGNLLGSGRKYIGFLGLQSEGGKVLITNAISLNMLPQGCASGGIIFRRVTLDEAKRLVRKADTIVSAIGHADTARVDSQQHGIELLADRRSVLLGDELMLVAQYIGPRLPEGATELPSGARLEFFVVRLATGEELAGRGDMVFYPMGTGS